MSTRKILKSFRSFQANNRNNRLKMFGFRFLYLCLNDLHIESSAEQRYSEATISMTSKNLFYMFILLLLYGCDHHVQGIEMCEPALSHLVQHGVADPNLMHHLPNNGSEVCRGGPCCMPSMTEKMLSRGRHLMHAAVQKETTSLLEAVAEARDAFRDAIESALYSSELRTIDTFKSSYPRLVGHIKEPLRELFSSLHLSLTSTDESSIERSLATFWDDLFPIVYHSTVHSRLPPFTQTYMECLRKSRRAIKPWKVVPSLIADSLTKGLDTARLMMRILNVASDVVFNIGQYEIPEECGNAAVRLYFCGSCHAAMVSPCSGLCLNVARGCLAPLAEINGMWNSLGTSASRVQEAMKTVGLAQLLKELPERFSDAIMVALESGTKLQKMVRNKCGPYSHEVSAEWTAKTQEGLQDKAETTSTVVSDSDLVGQTLIQKSEEAAAVLSSSHNFWRELADGTCAHLTSRVENCWNGDQIAVYSRQVADVGVSAQKYNPEVQVLRPDTAVYALNDEMRTVKRAITKALIWMPESDSYKQSDTDGYEGSGFPPNERYRNHDDEDAEDDGMGSGSFYAGSGDMEIVSNFGDAERKNRPPTQGSSQRMCSLGLLVLTLLLTMNWNTSTNI